MITGGGLSDRTRAQASPPLRDDDGPAARAKYANQFFALLVATLSLDEAAAAVAAVAAFANFAQFLRFNFILFVQVFVKFSASSRGPQAPTVWHGDHVSWMLRKSHPSHRIDPPTGQRLMITLLVMRLLQPSVSQSASQSLTLVRSY